ncbi:MAG: glycosyl hydrolase [Verrucomicrobiota bacterium]|nr:glycosyl hydrolase [Verrucomicrobiota bacterium]
MALCIDFHLHPEKLVPAIERLFELSAEKILSLEKSWKDACGAPVFTVNGRYTTRGWTDWTAGFRHGSALLQYDATGDKKFFDLGLNGTLRAMPTHISHTGVHDHGFNIVSTYGNLRRLILEGRAAGAEPVLHACELALKISGAVQAARWAHRPGGGYIYSFNGPHSLFIDTLRSLRSLALAHQLGHVLFGEQDQRISLLGRLIDHGLTTAQYNVYYGEGRDIYDVAGRVAHEAIFNTVNGQFRCPNSQQGYSPLSTWTRGLAWAILGFAEQLEFLNACCGREHAVGGESATIADVLSRFLRATVVTADYYISMCCADGIPVWDTGAPNLHKLGDYANRPADPFNEWEPVDSSAAAIAAQGLLRLGNHLRCLGRHSHARRYRQSALTIARTLFAEPYLATNRRHQGLILHSVYHRPKGWDHVAKGQRVPNGESSMWGDYHARELALMILREARRETYLTFFCRSS